MTTTTQTTSKRATFKRYAWISLALIFVILTIVGSIIYFGSFSTGDRAGVVIKISQRGYLFKTWEGEMNLNDQGNTIDKFEFSINGDNTKVIEQLREAALTGERVRVVYEEKYMTFPWRGDTQYFITDVIRRGDGERAIRGREEEKTSIENNDKKIETPTTTESEKDSSNQQNTSTIAL